MSTKRAECPLCEHVFEKGTQGWEAHIARNPERHPNWRPDLVDQKERAWAFRLDFPAFFLDSRHPNRLRSKLRPLAKTKPRATSLRDVVREAIAGSLRRSFGGGR